jgi:hypothetical protein
MTTKDDGGPLRIEAGKYYRTRYGQRVGPIERVHGLAPYVWRGKIAGAFPSVSMWQESGLHSPKLSPHNGLDLVAEWPEEPASPACVRAVTRLEIVPGTYGRVGVSTANGGLYVDISTHPINASELRAAARTFNALAEALEHGK